MLDTLLDEIRDEMANLSRGQKRRLSSAAPPGTWSIRAEDDCEGVAIDVPDCLDFHESFANAELITGHFGGSGKQLALLCRRRELRLEFAHVCKMFVLADRAELSSNPAAWWERISGLIGNALSNEAVHSLVAELLTYKFVLEHLPATKWEWAGPTRARHDLRGSSVDVEVKSTIVRDSSVVIVHGDKQLQPADDKPLWLAFVRLEASSAGLHSVDSLVAEILPALADDSALIAKLHEGLAASGCEPGRTARSKRFGLLETQFYPVDETFPRLVPSSFVGGKPPVGIGKIQYEILLESIPSVTPAEWLSRLGAC